MSRRKISCLSAASALVLAYGWSGAALADAAQGASAITVPPAVQGTLVSEAFASDLLISSILKGYDVFSAAELNAALAEALVPMTSERARILPQLMANIRLLGFDQQEEAAALAILNEALWSAPVDAVSSGEMDRLAQALQVAAGAVAGTQAAEADINIELTPPEVDCGGFAASSEFECQILQRFDNENVGTSRGTDGYSG